MSFPDHLDRRNLLRTVGTAGVAVIAGCSSDDTGSEGPSSTVAEPNATNTPPSGGSDPQQLPITGDPAPDLQPLEESVLDYMREREIMAGGLAVSRYGTVVYERGFGWSDRERSEPVSPDALFRVGSVSKPLTDAAIRRLVDTGRLATREHVYPLLEVDPPSGSPADARFHEITVGHLLAHQGGWNRREATDPLFDPLGVAEELELSEPPGRADIVRYVLEQPLQFDPGTHSVYSNVGYSLLAAVIEGVTGRDYHEYLETEILEPAGAGDIRPGRTAPDDRPAREVAYDDSEQCPNGLALDPDERVPCVDGGIVLEALEGACGHVASTGSLLAYMDDYWLDGTPRESTDREWVYFGSLPGAFAMITQRTDGVDIAALFNRRTGDAESLHPMLSRAVDEVDDWPY